MRSSRHIALLLGVALVGLLSTSALAQRQLDPLPGQHGHLGPYQAPYVAPPGVKSGTWTPLLHGFPGSTFPDTPLLLTDGTVIMHDGCTTDWYKLTPDNTGNYQKGTWTKTASMQAGYQPLYFASQVLADGRVIVNGGEYNNCSAVWTTLGSLYDPVADRWTAVSPPVGWTTIGDAQSIVRADGVYMLANCCTSQAALATIVGTTVTWSSTGTGKADINDEEGWTILPGGNILAVDANRNLTMNFSNTEYYSPATGAWTAGQNTIGRMTDTNSHEIGPASLLPNGLVFQAGGTGHTGVLDTVTGAWTAGPDFPTILGQLYNAADAPSAVLPNGNVLIQLSPGVFNSPSHFFEVKVRKATKVKIKQVSDPASAPNQSSYEGRMLVLPTGQVLWGSDVGDVEIYTPKGKAKKAWAPTITSAPVSVSRGSANNLVQGTLFNGLTMGGAYGDDAQTATNYPLVRIINGATGHVCYARTHNHSAMGISTVGVPTSTQFDVPISCETGASQLVVVTNGIPSAPVAITVN